MSCYVWDLTGFTPVFLGREEGAAKRVATLERQGQRVAAFAVFNHPGYVAVFKKRAEIEGESLKGRPGLLSNGKHSLAGKKRKRKPCP